MLRSSELNADECAPGLPPSQVPPCISRRKRLPLHRSSPDSRSRTGPLREVYSTGDSALEAARATGRLGDFSTTSDESPLDPRPSTLYTRHSALSHARLLALQAVLR